MNWLVLGIGDISRKRVIPAILSEPRSRLHSIVTRDPAKARDYPDAHIYTDLTDALQNRGVDAVYVATPVSLHAAQTIAALAAGKHVLCEKPAALDFKEALQMQSAAEKSGKLLAIAYYRRLFPNLIDAKRRMEAGEIGRPLLVEANCHGWLPAEDRGWLRDPKLAGAGPLYDVACHRIDAINFLFGCEPVRAMGLVSNVLHATAVEDSATVLIDYASGPRAIVDVRWNSHVDRDQFRVIGTDGAIDLSPLSAGQNPPNVHYPLIENFVSACLGEAPLACPMTESLKTDRVLSAVRLQQPLDCIHA